MLVGIKRVHLLVFGHYGADFGTIKLVLNNPKLAIHTLRPFAHVTKNVRDMRNHTYATTSTL